MPSTAYTELGNRLTDVDELMAAHQAVSGLSRGRKYDVSGLNRAAVLMLSAHLEGYLEDVMAEAVSYVNPQLSSATLTDRFHNPWPDRIDDLFAFLGLVKPSRQISWQKASNASVRKNIEDLVRMRNRIAHGSTGTSVVKADITRWRKYVEGFASRFDNVVRAQVKVLAGNYPWSRWSA